MKTGSHFPVLTMERIMEFQIVSDVLKKYEGNSEHVVIPEGIREIDDYAFYGAHAMKTLTIPSTVKEIGANAFYDCASLKEAVLPDSLLFLGSAAFARCSELKRVWLPDSLTSLSRILFFGCEKLEEIRLPVNLTKIGRACFQNCMRLNVIVLPKTLKILEDSVFDGCRNLEAVFFPEKLEEIGNNVFFGCENLAELRIPENIRSVGSGAFETKGRLSLEMPSGFVLKPAMLDAKWNMYWNEGSVKNEKRYLLHDSYIPSLRINEFKPYARTVLAVNYLETYRHHIDEYEKWIAENTDLLIDMIVDSKRFSALNRALTEGIISSEEIEPYLSMITDRDEKAKLLEIRRNAKKDDDLLGLDLDDLF